jgi:hypothetical protein
MYGTKSHAASCNRQCSNGAPSLAGAKADPRRIALLASGRRHGPITRLITPSDIGELTKPFIFLDYAEVAPGPRPLFGICRHSSTATLTVALYDAGPASGEPVRAFQLCVALSPADASSQETNEHVASQEVEEVGPVRVILGQFGQTRSRISNILADINYFHVRLKEGQRWRYLAPDRHNVTWLAVDRGGLQLQEGERVYWEQIAVFGDSAGVIEAQAEGDTSFVLGSARRHRHPLVHEEHSAYTGLSTIAQGEAEVPRITPRLRVQGSR